jgi:uncharacterized protein YndB with AHSA1/START domain
MVSGASALAAAGDFGSPGKRLRVVALPLSDATLVRALRWQRDREARRDEMKAPVASAAMLIRRPPAYVFQAFADPAITTRFWFTRASGRLEPGASVRWTWDMYGVSTEVKVRAFDPDLRIRIDWDVQASPTEVEWTFTPHAEGTFVEVENRGFAADEAGFDKAMDSATGFTLVLAAAKIWLEHGIEPDFVLDRHPAAIVEGWREPV